MIRVVLDTNVVVSAVLSPSGPSFEIIALANQKLIQLYASSDTFDEYREVLAWPQFVKLKGLSDLQLAEFSKLCRFVTPSKGVTASPDQKDNMFLECAEAAKAHYLVTGNVRHFPKRWKYSKTITPRQFLDLFGALPKKIRR